MRVETYGARQDKAVVVIGVLSDEVHAARRAENLRIRDELFIDQLFELLQWLVTWAACSIAQTSSLPRLGMAIVIALSL